MKEVEIKIKINSAEQVLKQLQNKGCQFSAEIIQEDIVFIPNEIPGVPAPAGTNVLRIRKQKDKTIFTLKQSMKGNHLAKLEKEVEIEDSGEMAEIIRLLGYKEIAHTNKVRRKCRYGDYEICVDRIKELGDFLEMEKMTAEDPHQVQAEMFQVLDNLGINITEKIDVGYDVLYFRKYN